MNFEGFKFGLSLQRFGKESRFICGEGGRF